MILLIGNLPSADDMYLFQSVVITHFCNQAQWLEVASHGKSFSQSELINSE